MIFCKNVVDVSLLIIKWQTKIKTTKLNLPFLYPKKKKKKKEEEEEEEEEERKAEQV